MYTSLSQPFFWLHGLRWLARILSLASIGILLLFLIGEGFNPAAVRFKEGALLAFFPLGVVFGLAIAWWREGLGGAITAGSLLAFHLAHLLLRRQVATGLGFRDLCLTRQQFLAYWLLPRSDKRRGEGR
jgi:hypothetical protein